MERANGEAYSELGRLSKEVSQITNFILIFILNDGRFSQMNYGKCFSFIS